MSSIRVLVGTKKGAFILTADGQRRNWQVTGPHFAGWEIYHLKGSALDPNRLFASQSSGWFGQIIQRSDDGGKTWSPPGTKPEDLMGPDGMPNGKSNEFRYEGTVGTHKWYDGTQHPWEFKRIWHLEPSLTDPDLVYAGAEDAALFHSRDGGKSWQPLVSVAPIARARYLGMSYSWSGKTLALSAVSGRTLVWVSRDDGDTWVDESGDYTALSGGIAQWYDNTLYISSMGQGISAKVFNED